MTAAAGDCSLHDDDAVQRLEGLRHDGRSQAADGRVKRARPSSSLLEKAGLALCDFER